MRMPPSVSKSTLAAVELWAAYYRSNPHRFARDVLKLDLRLFQKILLCAMFISTTFVFIACRGIGKTYLSAIYCVVKAILYPGSKIVIASGTRGQSLNILEKIMLELRPKSKALDMEIDDKQTKINGTNAILAFKNGSYIKVVTSGDSARGNRAHVLLIDEFRLVDKRVVDDVLSKFLTSPRMPEYSELSKAEKMAAYNAEKHQTLYLSSAFFSDNWSFTKCKDVFKMMLDDRRTDFVFGFPYQLAIKENLIKRETIEDMLLDSDFSEVKFLMEMCAEFFGANEDAFFEFDSVAKNRKIKYPMLPEKLASKLGNNALVKIPHKQNGEKRILSADIALMSSRRNKNDATSIFVTQLLPTKAGRYMDNVVYADSNEGLRTDDQALVIRKLFDEFECDWLVLDTNGLGLGVYDSLAKDIVDPDTGEIYPALSCYNNSEMASRCTVQGAKKVIWSIKATPTFNSDCAFLLREAFRSGRIRLLETEYDAEESLSAIKGYNALSPADKISLQMPYIHTTLLIDELTKLQHEEVSGRIKIYEKTGMRKDRYSSLSYNYYVATQIEAKMNKRAGADTNTSELFVIRPPKFQRKAVNASSGREHTKW